MISNCKYCKLIIYVFTLNILQGDPCQTEIYLPDLPNVQVNWYKIASSDASTQAFVILGQSMIK